MFAAILIAIALTATTTAAAPLAFIPIPEPTAAPAPAPTSTTESTQDLSFADARSRTIAQNMFVCPPTGIDDCKKVKKPPM